MPDEIQLIITQAPQVEVEVTTAAPPVVQLTLTPSPQIVNTIAVGPQGIQGIPGTVSSLTSVPDLDAGARIDKSLLYYDAATARFRLDTTITATTITDGGNY